MYMSLLQEGALHIVHRTCAILVTIN